MRIAMFGAGRIGRLHAQHVAEHLNLNLAYVVDPVEANAFAVAAMTGAVVTDAARVFSDPAIEGVVIASPTGSHADLLQRAATAGKAIFCEKPLSLDFVTAQSCVHFLNKHGTRCMMGFQRRYDPSIQALREHICDGQAGDVHQLIIFSRSGSIPSIEYVKASGGLFRDSSIHDLDMARYLLGEEMNTVYAVGRCLADKDIGAMGDVDTAMITMVSRSGKLVQINTGRHSPFGYDQRIEVLASKELLRVDYMPRNTLVVGTRAGFTSAAPMETFMDRYKDAYRAEMEAFAQLIEGGKSPLADHNDGLEAQRLAEAAARSMYEGRPILL